MKEISIASILGVLLVSMMLFSGCTSSGEESAGESQVQDQSQNQETQQQTPPQNEGLPDRGRSQNRSGPGQGPPEGRMTMPSEMIDSCAGKNENESCQYTRDQETVTGTCRTMREGQMVCFSGDMEQMRNRTRIMSEDSSACDGKGVGDQCNLSMGERVIEGSCINMDDKIVCMPANRTGFQRPGPITGQL